MKRMLVVCLSAACALAAASGAFAAIGVYKTTASPNVPSVINYMLNTNANGFAGESPDWSVKVEIKPVIDPGPPEVLGPAVRTWSFLWNDSTPPPECLKGQHQLIWDGKKDDGTGATPGNYRAVISACAAPITGTNLVPLWESTRSTTTIMDCAVNSNPDSPFYGYVYAVDSGDKNVYMYEPDGSNYGGGPTEYVFSLKSSNGWNGSAPWGVDVDGAGHVWVSPYTMHVNPNYSYVCEYNETGTWMNELNFYDGSAYKNLRFMSVDGSGTSWKFVGTYWVPTQANPTIARLYVASGYPPTLPFTELNISPAQALMDPKYDADGNINLVAYSDAGGGTSGGDLIKFNTSGGVLASNTNIRRGTGFAIGPDGSFWVARFVTGVSPYTDTDPTAIYKITDPYNPLTNPDTDTNVVKYGLACTPAAKRAYSIDCDAVGNIVAAAGNTQAVSANPNCAVVGVYAPPDNGSSDTRQTNILVWTGDYQPAFEGSNAPVSVSSCITPAPSTTLDVYVSDWNGYADVGGVFLDMSQFGGADHTPMNYVPGSGSGNNATYRLNFSVPNGTRPGSYTCNVYVWDVHHPMVTESVGQVVIIVTGGWISGRVVCSDVPSWGIAGATVTATDGVNPPYTTTTDSNGDYVLGVAPGNYTVNADKGTGYAVITDSTLVTVTCNATTSNVVRQLGPVDVPTATGNNYRYSQGRTMGEPVLVRGVVLRTHYVAGVQNGLNNSYYIYSTSAGIARGGKILTYPGQDTLVEGDDVVVEGIWTFPMGGMGYYQGHVQPIRAPVKLQSNRPLPAPTAFTGAMMNYNYGRYFKVSGPVLALESTRFLVDCPDGPTYTSVWVKPDTIATTGVTMPTSVGQLVEVTGMLAMLDSFGDNVICPGKPSDVQPWPTVSSIGAAKALGDGGVIIDVGGGAPMIVTDKDCLNNPPVYFYVEMPDRSSGIKVVAPSDAWLPTWPGYTVTKLVGRLETVTGDRQLSLAEQPTYTAEPVSNVPEPVAMNNLATGGTWFGGTPPVSQPPGAGLNNQGLFVKVYGKVLAIEGIPPSIVWIDDGSGVKGWSATTPATEVDGLRCEIGAIEGPAYSIQPPELSVGDVVAVTGILGSQWVNDLAHRYRVLRMRYVSDGGVNDFWDTFQIIKDEP